MTMTLMEAPEISLDRTYSLEEFLNLGLEEDYELIEGALMAKSEASGKSAEHYRVIGQLSFLIQAYLENNPIAEFYTQGPTTLGVTSPKPNYVEPDVMAVLLKNLPPGFSGLTEALPVAPDLAIELWSPTDDAKKIQNRIESYQRAGVSVIWSIYMMEKFAIIYRKGEELRTFVELDGELDADSVLPGFKVTFSRLFRRTNASSSN
jgi:Uma2 family endonuclease